MIRAALMSSATLRSDDSTSNLPTDPARRMEFAKAAQIGQDGPNKERKHPQEKNEDDSG